MASDKVRFSMLFDRRVRKKHKMVLAFSGASFGASGSVSILNLQEFMLKAFPDVLERFPDYKSFFSLSTWFSFSAGLLFFIIPTTFTLWIGVHLIGISILYLFCAAKGVAAQSPLALIVPYWATVAAIVLQHIGDSFRFYFKHTQVDGWILAGFKLAFVVWSLCIFVNLYIGGE